MQNRFITFDERLMPGPQFDREGLFFDQQSYHNIPGYLDNVMVSACMLSLTASCSLTVAGRLACCLQRDL